MKVNMLRGVAWLQRSTAALSFRWHSSRSGITSKGWIVGPTEIANMATTLAAALPDSYLVILDEHKFYVSRAKYQGANKKHPWLVRMIAEGWTFGRLTAQTKGAVYVGPNGYLRAQSDFREYEFAFLKRRKRVVCCFFTGSDIRSVRVMLAKEGQGSTPSIATYLPVVAPDVLLDSFDSSRRQLAATADAYADVIFTARDDQEGYLQSETLPFRYFHPSDQIFDPSEKFAQFERPIVLHAPSSPVIKGTQLVRAAVSLLKEEGLDFEYVELIGVPNEEVVGQLRRAHVVMNQFYGFMPGVFGVEAMAAGTVMLCSADEHHERDLPPGSNDAWVVTPHYRVAEELRKVLSSSKQEMFAQALAGQHWVCTHATAEVSSVVVIAALESAYCRLQEGDGLPQKSVK